MNFIHNMATLVNPPTVSIVKDITKFASPQTKKEIAACYCVVYIRLTVGYLCLFSRDGHYKAARKVPTHVNLTILCHGKVSKKLTAHHKILVAGKSFLSLILPFSKSWHLQIPMKDHYL